jgi:hypothetical protein
MTKDLTTSPRATIDAFLKKHALQRPSGGRGRLIFGLDATASRRPTWDLATSLTAKMFAVIGGLPLDVQLVFYRGIDECRASAWVSDGRALNDLMKTVHCEAGETQIDRILNHARKEDLKRKVSAMAFIGDSCEENSDTLVITARKLSLPVFLFQEGDDAHTAEIFGGIARATRGVHCQFDQGSAQQLAELLGAAAAYAAGGLKALGDLKGQTAIKLLEQLK